MFSNEKHNKYLVATILTISLCANLFFSIQLKTLKQKVTTSNTVTYVKLESAIRDTMHSVKELNKIDNEDTINNLQLSVRQLLLTFSNWVDLNQDKENSNEILQKGLAAVETLRNTIVYSLGNQYSNNGQLTHYDIVLLDRVYEKLDRLLVIYNNIEKDMEKTKNVENKGINGLSQWAENVEEICRLYRHSRIPNEHLSYIQLDLALTKVDEAFPILNNFKGKREIDELVKVRDGLHYYEVSYYYEDELSYLVWVDAMDGTIRLFEDYMENFTGDFVYKNEALNIAKNFMNDLDAYDEVIDSASIIVDENLKDTIYAFQFTPVLDDISIVSDSVQVSVSSKGGNIVKYSSNFSNTKVPSTKPSIDLEDVEEMHKEQLIDAQYIGLSAVRSFYTHYKPVIAYSYNLIENENITKLYFDITTGNQIYESFSIYEPIQYTATEDY